MINHHIVLSVAVIIHSKISSRINSSRFSCGTNTCWHDAEGKMHRCCCCCSSSSFVLKLFSLHIVVILILLFLFVYQQTSSHVSFFFYSFSYNHTSLAVAVVAVNVWVSSSSSTSALMSFISAKKCRRPMLLVDVVKSLFLSLSRDNLI